MREQVNIERGGPNFKPGLPRPLARAQGVLRPVPWTNHEDEGWGLIHNARATQCEDMSLCLVCGEAVEDGFIFVSDQNAPVRATEAHLSRFAADHGPLHSRCAKMTVAHCQRVRSDIFTNVTFMIPYCRQDA